MTPSAVRAGRAARTVSARYRIRSDPRTVRPDVISAPRPSNCSTSDGSSSPITDTRIPSLTPSLSISVRGTRIRSAHGCACGPSSSSRDSTPHTRRSQPPWTSAVEMSTNGTRTRASGARNRTKSVSSWARPSSVRPSNRPGTRLPSHPRAMLREPVKHQGGESPMTYEQLIVDRDGAVATVRMNNPAKLNAALGTTLSGELRDAMAELGADDDCRAIVLTGEGRGFCVGADLGALQPLYSAGERPELGGIPARGLQPADPAVHGHAEARHRRGQRRRSRRRRLARAGMRHPDRQPGFVVPDGVRPYRAGPGLGRDVPPASDRGHGRGAQALDHRRSDRRRRSAPDRPGLERRPGRPVPERRPGAGGSAWPPCPPGPSA